MGEGAFCLWLERWRVPRRRRTHGEILGVAASSAAVPRERLARSPGAARADDAAGPRGRRAGDRTTSMWSTRRRTRRAASTRSRRSALTGSSAAPATVVTSIKGALGEFGAVRQRRLRRGAALRRLGRVPPIAGLECADPAAGVAAPGARRRSTRPGRSCSSTASRAAARCSASCFASRRRRRVRTSETNSDGRRSVRLSGPSRSG